MSNGCDAREMLARFHAATNALDFHAIEAMFAPGVVYVSNGVGGRIEGRDAVMAAFRAYFTEYPDQVSQDQKLELLPGNAARSLWRLEATSATTGLKLLRQGVETIRLDADGLIDRVDVEG